MAFTFVHTADLHLDSPFEGLHATAPEVAAVLRNATFQAFDRVVDLAVQEQAAFLVVAGDVYDGADRSLRAQLRFREALARAAAHGVQSFVAHGNHDPLSGWEAGLTMPPQVHRFGADAVEEAAVIQGGETLARIFGISFAGAAVTDNLAARFPRPGPGPFAIGVLHSNVGGNPDYDNYAPCTLAHLEAAGLNYWALGHIHARQVLRPHNPVVAYPGNPQGRSWREPGERGCYLVRVDDDGRVGLTFAATDGVRWAQRQVDISGFTDVDALLEALAALREDVRREADGRHVLWRVQLAGRGPVHTLLQRREALPDVVQQLRDGELERETFVWLDFLMDATRPALDLDQRRTFRDFVGDFLTSAQALRTAADSPQVLRQILAGQAGAKGIARELAAISDAELLALLDEAVTLGLDRLLPDDE